MEWTLLQSVYSIWWGSIKDGQWVVTLREATIIASPEYSLVFYLHKDLNRPELLELLGSERAGCPPSD